MNTPASIGAVFHAAIFLIGFKFKFGVLLRGTYHKDMTKNYVSAHRPTPRRIRRDVIRDACLSRSIFGMQSVPDGGVSLYLERLGFIGSSRVFVTINLSQGGRFFVLAFDAAGVVQDISEDFVELDEAVTWFLAACERLTRAANDESIGGERLCPTPSFVEGVQ